MGYLLSSFLWMYVLCLLPVGLLVDRFGGKVVNAAGIGIVVGGDGADRLHHRLRLDGRHAHRHGDG